MSLADHRYLTEATGKDLLRALEIFNTGAATTAAPTSDDEPRLITNETGDDIADELVAALGNLLHIFAPEYEDEGVYQSGSFCTRAGKYYQRNDWGSTTPAAESWTAAHWTQKTIAQIVTALQAAIDALDTPIAEKIPLSQKGVANGVATLDSNGLVPASQLPSYVDDILEYDNLAAFPATGETGKIYVAKDTNLTYRWTGTTYVEISQSLALGETSSTAYRGDRGKAAYDHAQSKGSAYASGLYKITTNSEGHVTNAQAVAKADITGLGIPAQDTTYTFDGTYNASTNKAATVSTVTDAINALDGNLNSTTPGSGKTLTAFAQTNGAVSARFGDISITKSQVSDYEEATDADIDNLFA